MRGRWSPAVAAALLLAASACSPQCGVATSNKTVTSPLAAESSAPSTSTTPLQIASATFHAGEVGFGYAAVTQSVSGGLAPYSWSVSAGSLPAGLTLGDDGSISGTPTASGTYTFTLRVADRGDSSATLAGAIAVAPQLTLSLLPACAQYCRVEVGCANACGGFGQVTGGKGPYSYTVVQAPLPAGTSLNGLSLAGTFKGLPGWLQFTVQATDAIGATATLAPRFWMYGHIALAGGTCGPSRLSCTVTLPYTGGTPGQAVSAAPIAWTGASCSLAAFQPCPEPSFAATYQPGAVVLKLTYQPNYFATFGTMTVQLTSSDLCGPGTQCTATASVSVQG